MTVVFLLVAYFIFILFFAVGACWFWPDFVDSNDPPQIRMALHTLLAVETALEVAIWASGMVRPWVLAVIFVANVWGMLDAFLRFPVVHDIDSLFGLKQVILITLKLIGYAIGFHNVGKYVGWFVLIILCCVFTVPILWLTALPIGDVTSYHQKHDRVDVDLAVRLWHVVRHKEERAMAAIRCKNVLRKMLVFVATGAPFLRSMILRWDPSLARALRKAPGV